MPRYLLSFLFLIYSFYVMFCFVLTSPPLMLCVYLQTFEAALFWKKKKKKSYISISSQTFSFSFLNFKIVDNCFIDVVFWPYFSILFGNSYR